MKIDKTWIVLGFVLLLLGLVQATSSDGNYTLLQTDIVGSGDNASDGNLTMFFDAGEPATQQHSEDQNYNTGTGFYAEGFIARIVTAVKVAVQNIFFIQNPSDNNVIVPLVIFSVFIVGVALYVFIKRKKELDDNEEFD